ncbi:hypothetical protein COCVIDRAFT_110355 [Bipolaris victoriae FI3]|uniref:Uncharacterized protein n=1 Tax=Bipolaris victoriae (strain FI3) TaxID=930091 RepID=W7DXP8_BIPV3|nr:hypothetical protein COCVIDRAFT_110355 [Bipolaris victoriae FI3]
MDAVAAAAAFRGIPCFRPPMPWAAACYRVRVVYTLHSPSCSNKTKQHATASLLFAHASWPDWHSCRSISSNINRLSGCPVGRCGRLSLSVNCPPSFEAFKVVFKHIDTRHTYGLGTRQLSEL